jgi:hypothetical protein
MEEVMENFVDSWVKVYFNNDDEVLDAELISYRNGFLFCCTDDDDICIPVSAVRKVTCSAHPNLDKSICDLLERLYNSKPPSENS